MQKLFTTCYSIKYIAMEYIVTIDDSNRQALEVIEYLKKFNFVKIVNSRKAKSELISQSLEEDEDGLPLKYKEEILSMSKSVNKKIGQRWNEEREKRLKKEQVI